LMQMATIDVVDDPVNYTMYNPLNVPVNDNDN
jgi:hypothetical protein